jgi:inosine/xanthosine triphosphate pyrophosphatase family protein
MTREFIYTEDSYKKLRLSDINVKKKNVTNKAIAEENNLIVSEISGYPAFYTQMIFDKDNSTIKIKTVLNNTEGESLVAKCENIINYKKES